MIYMGYMRADKGFFFLLDALESLPDALARNLHLRLAARALNDPINARRLARLARHLGALQHVDGYAHDELPSFWKTSTSAWCRSCGRTTSPRSRWKS